MGTGCPRRSHSVFTARLQGRQVMISSTPLALGLDFGTASVRALLVDRQGNERGAAVVKYRHGQITQTLPGGKTPLPADFALQHPNDWLESAARAGPARPWPRPARWAPR